MVSSIKSFRIVAGAIDQVTVTDGIHVTTANLGPQFPKGVFIAQDGKDDKGKQNFNWNDDPKPARHTAMKLRVLEIMVENT